MTAAFSAKGFTSIGQLGSPDGTPGSRRRLHTYVTNDLLTEVATSDYFLSIYKLLQVGDLILVAADLDGTPAAGMFVVSACDAENVDLVLATATAAE